MSTYSFTRASDGSVFVLDTAHVGEYLQLNFQVNPSVVHVLSKNQPEQDVAWSNIQSDTTSPQQFNGGFLLKETTIAGGQTFVVSNDGDYVKVVKVNVLTNGWEVKAQGVVHHGIIGSVFLADSGSPVSYAP